MVSNFANLGKETNIQVQEARRVPSKMNPEMHTPIHNIIKMVNLRVT